MSRKKKKPIERSKLISFRSYDKERDLPFVYDSWLKGLYFGSAFYQKLFPDQKDFHIHYAPIIGEICLNENTTIRIACLSDDADIMMGYSVFEKKEDATILHWVFVKEVWRKIGIAKDLIPSKIDAVSHLTDLGIKLKPEHLPYNPSLIS